MPEKKIGLFDPEGNYDNPLTGKPYQNLYQGDTIIKDGKEIATTYKYFAKIVHEQPLIANIQNSYDILDKLRNNQVLVIESATGTGKTVVLPKLASHLLDYKGKVVVTVPKQSLAKGNADFCARCMDVRLGDEVGYAHRGSEIVIKEQVAGEEIVVEQRGSSSDETKILFATDGWLASRESNEMSFKDYGVVMIDEVHERNSNIDKLLLYLRQALIINDQLKVIITSATLDMEMFVDYFASKGISVASKSVSKETNFTVTPVFLNKKITGQNLISESVAAYKKYLFDKNIKEDCIIFTNSTPGADRLCKELEKLSKKIFCIRATATTVEKDKTLKDQAANEPTKDPFLIKLYQKKGYDRRVIVATEVWESSITLPLLKYVIEPGVALVSEYDGERMQSSLLNKQLLKARLYKEKVELVEALTVPVFFFTLKKILKIWQLTKYQLF